MNKLEIIERIRSISLDAICFPSETRSLLLILADDIEKDLMSKMQSIIDGNEDVKKLAEDL